MAGTGSGRINPAGSCLPDIRPDSRIRKFEKAGYPGSGDPAKTPIRWNPTAVSTVLSAYSRSKDSYKHYVS